MSDTPLTTSTPPTQSSFAYPPKRLSGTKVFFITVASVVIGLFAFLFLLTLFILSLGALAAGDDESLGNTVVLEIDLRSPLLDTSLPTTLFGESPASMVGIVRALDRAKSDDDIKGLFIRGEVAGLAPASSEELRLALIDFKESGKFVITHAQGLNSTSIIAYQALSASDEIWLQASTSLATAGLYSQTEFLGGVMEKTGADPQFVKHGDYKTAVNSYTETGFTEAHRESTTSLLTSIFDSAVDNIALDRELDRAVVLNLLGTAPHSAAAARDAGLIDQLGYFEEARKHAAEQAGDEDAAFLPIAEYKPASNFGKPIIALIEGQGPILPGISSGDNLFGSDPTMGGETLAAGLDAALEDEDVKAVIFRVSSGGGSAAASDQIMAGVERVQAAGIPVIVSMGQYAASGGYYLAAPADHIVAMPQTITGSIGVFGGKIALEDAFAKIGLNLEAIRVGGDYAGAYNIDTPFTEAQREGFEREIDTIYRDFVQVVADGRDMTPEEVIAVAEGRVWTGEQALDRGLVDELGGFDTALRAAKRFAEIDEADPVRLKRFPRPKSREDLFNEFLSGVETSGEDLGQLRALMRSPEVQAALRVRAALSASDETLRAPLPIIE